jgi:hypothetical protein
MAVPDINSKNWYAILDARVLKEGMRIKSCLDMGDPMYEDEDDEESDAMHWFSGKIVRYGILSEDFGWQVIVEKDIPYRDGGRDEPETWEINLNKENMEYFQIWVKEWDD